MFHFDLHKIRVSILHWLPAILRMKHPPELEESYRNRSRASQPQEYCIHEQRQSNDPMQRTWDTRTFNHDVTSSPSLYDLEELARKMKDLQSLCSENGCHQLADSLPCPASRNRVLHSSSSNLLNCNVHAQHVSQRPAGNGNLNYGQASLEPLNINHIGGTLGAAAGAGHRYAFQSYANIHDQIQPYLVSLPSEEAATILHYGHNHRSTATATEPRTSSSDAALAQERSKEEQVCKCCELNNAEFRQLFNQDCYEKLMQELYFLTNRIRREDDLSDIVAEWKFAAIVIDRACLIVFSTFAVLSLAGCLSYAPHLIV